MYLTLTKMNVENVQIGVEMNLPAKKKTIKKTLIKNVYKLKPLLNFKN